MTTDIRLDILYKKFIVGVPTAYPNGNPSAEAGFDKPMIFPSLQVISQDIPGSAPTTDLSNVTITYLNPVVSGTQKQVSTSKPHIAKYTKLPLIDVGGGAGFAFGYSKTQSLNLCTQSIPFNYDLAVGTYAINVFDSTGTEIYSNNATYPWVFDGDGGVLLFTGGNKLPGLPSINFWRYEGTFGGSSGSGSSIGNGDLTTVIGDVSFNGNVTVGKNLGIGKTNARYPIDTPGIAACGAVFQFDSDTGVNTLNTTMVGGVYNSQILYANAGLTVPVGQVFLNNGTTNLTGTTTMGTVSITGPITSSGGLSVTSGGLSVTSGGLSVTSGSTTNNIIGNLLISGNTIIGNLITGLKDASLNGRLFLGGDLSLNQDLWVKGNIGIGTTGDGIFPLDVRTSASTINTGVGTTVASFSGSTPNGPYGSNRINMNLSSFIDASGLPTNSISVIDDSAGSGHMLFSSKTGHGTGSATMTERMRITPAGYIGIGKTNPEYRLDVSGDTSISGDLIVNGNLSIQKINNQFIINTTTTNYQLIISEDISLNGRLFTSGDASLNGRLYVKNTVGLGILNPNYTLDVSGNAEFTQDISMGGRLLAAGDISLNGNVSIGRVLRPTTISEPFITNIGTTSPYTFDYNQGATFYVTTPPATNFTVNITNVPSDINRTYCFTIIISSATNKRFCNSLQINGATAITPRFANGIPTSITASATTITQSISIQRITVGDLTANVIVLSSVTGWY